MTTLLTKSIAAASVAATLMTTTLVGLPTTANAAAQHPSQPSRSAHFFNGRGTVISSTPIAQLTAAQLDAAGAEVFAGVPKSSYGVTIYRVIYRTIDHFGRPTTASGIVVLPQGRHGALTVTEYLHGTNPTKAAAASTDDTSADRLITELFAGQGLVGVAPDYLGLGLGPGLHPYVDTKTEVSASADLLIAARTVGYQHGVQLRHDVLVTGFSQGGQAAVALGRSLSRGEVGSFRLGGLRAVSGPYDLLGEELPAAFDGRLEPEIATFYLAYFVTAWNRTVGLYNDPRQAFQEPYADTVEGLFDGLHTEEQIAAGLPDSPDKLFTPAFAAELQHPTGRLLRAVQAFDQVCQDWTPPVRVHLYFGTKDTDVAPADTASCATWLRQSGAAVTVHSMGPVDHNGSAVAAYPEIIRAYAKWAQR